MEGSFVYAFNMFKVILETTFPVRSLWVKHTQN